MNYMPHGKKGQQNCKFEYKTIQKKKKCFSRFDICMNERNKNLLLDFHEFFIIIICLCTTNISTYFFFAFQ